jgi:ABC-2 type transport system permease protein
MINILLAEIREELLSTIRNPAAVFFSMVMPVGFFALTVGMFGNSDGFDLTGFAAYGAFSVMMVVMMNPGIGLAEARQTGWMRVKRASGAPVGVALAAKVAAAIPYAVTVLAAMIATLFAFGRLDGSVGAMTRTTLALVIAGLPFALFGLAAGARFSTNAATALLNGLMFPLVVASGLWFPLEILPEAIQGIAPWLPPYHLSELAAAAGAGELRLASLGALGLTAAIGATVAALAYRSAEL